MSQVPAVLVVIVNYNHEKCLEDLMTSVLATKYLNFQVVLIDNASTDKSRELLETFDDRRLEKILLPENLGLCKARNLGASHKESAYYAFLDSDVKVTPMWLQKLVDILESDPSVGIAESTILSQLPYAASSTEIVKLYALGAAFLVKNNVWHKVDGFDNDYFVGYDDIDLGWRTWLAGYKVVRVPDSTVYHVGGLLRKCRGVRLFRYHGFKNRLSSLITNFEPLTFLYETPRILIALAVSSFEDFRDGQIDCLLGVFWILKNMRKLLRKRILIQTSRRIKDKDIKQLWDPSAKGSLHHNRLTLW